MKTYLEEGFEWKYPSLPFPFVIYCYGLPHFLRWLRQIHRLQISPNGVTHFLIQFVPHSIAQRSSFECVAKYLKEKNSTSISNNTFEITQSIY